MIPRDHPRYESLKLRDALVEGTKDGVTVLQGLIAHGRGEAFDYLIGEETIEPANRAIKASAALLLIASNPVISVNGNTAVLCPKELVDLSDVLDAKLEINLFHRSIERAEKIKAILKKNGAKRVYGVLPSEEIESLGSERRLVDREGIFSSDVVLVPLEDGDRTEALIKNGKKVIAIDLNPLSRTSKTATITIVDNVVRAVPKMIEIAGEYKNKNEDELQRIVDDFDNKKNLKDCLRVILGGLENQ
ncbi:MAG: 4-phosphopantoate--beta-alanine ligase [Candidatus Hydrothermarchaeales archaeon]